MHEESMGHRTSEENRTLVAFCGLSCGDCHGFQGVVPDLARDLRKKLRRSNYDRFAHFLEGVHDDAHLKNLRILKTKGINAFLAGKRH